MKNKNKEIIKKIQEIKKKQENIILADLSRDEDLSIALMNLISLEEHFYFSAMKTENKQYLELLKETRNIRKELMKEIVTEPEGEEWCISKHLLATSMRLIETGTKELSVKGEKQALKFFKPAFELWSMFFGINLKLIKKEKLKENKKQEKTIKEKISKTIKEIIDCCKEW